MRRTCTHLYADRRGRGGGGGVPLGARGAGAAVGRAVPRVSARAGRPGRGASRGAAGLPAPAAPALSQRPAGAPAPRGGGFTTTLRITLEIHMFISYLP